MSTWGRRGAVAYIVGVGQLREGVNGCRTVCKRAEEWDSECGRQHHRRVFDEVEMDETGRVIHPLWA